MDGGWAAFLQERVHRGVNGLRHCSTTHGALLVQLSTYQDVVDYVLGSSASISSAVLRV